MMVARLGRDGNPTGYWGDQDDIYFVNFVVFGFFFIILVQLLGILLGDRSPIQVTSDIDHHNSHNLNKNPPHSRLLSLAIGNSHENF